MTTPSARNRRLAAVAVGSLALFAVHADFSDDFDAGPKEGWTPYEPLGGFGAPVTFTASNGGYQISVAGSPLPSVIGPGRGGSFRPEVTLGDFSVTCDLTAWSNTPIFAGAFARVTNLGLGTTDGYALGFDSSDNTLNISRVRGENVEAVVAFTSVDPLDPNHTYRLTYSGMGPKLSGSLRDLTSGLTLATVEGSDSAYASGIVGIGVVVRDLATPGVAGSATFDNFAATAVPELPVWMLLATGGVTLGWRVQQRRQ